MANYPTQESYRKGIADKILHPLRTQQPVLYPIRYVTGETSELLTQIARNASLSRVVVASIAGNADTHPRDVAIDIMEKWTDTGDHIPPRFDIMRDATIATAQHRLKQYQEQIADATNPKRPLLLIEGYDQLSVPLASLLIPTILAIATHASHNQRPGAVIMSGQTDYEKLSTHLRTIELTPKITQDSVIKS